MYCSNCGKMIPDGAKFCPECGADTSFAKRASQAADKMFDSAESELRDAVADVGNTFRGSSEGAAPYQGERLQDNRGLLSYILLSIITCGIYSYYFIYKMAHDINIACDGDGQSTGGLVKFILLSFVTCGIYSWIWDYNLGNRLQENAPRYGMSFSENGTSVLLWMIFGALICGIGPFVAMNILIKNSNRICNAYNRANHL